MRNQQVTGIDELIYAIGDRHGRFNRTAAAATRETHRFPIERARGVCFRSEGGWLRGVLPGSAESGRISCTAPSTGRAAPGLYLSATSRGRYSCDEVRGSERRPVDAWNGRGSPAAEPVPSPGTGRADQIRLPSTSSRCLEPVTVRAAPRNVSFVIRGHGNFVPGRQPSTGRACRVFRGLCTAVVVISRRREHPCR